MAFRKGGTSAELKAAAYVATNDGSTNNAGAGRGTTKNDPRLVFQVGGGRGFINPREVKPDNFAHKSDNIVVTDTSALALNTNFQSNILDNYRTYTYHWKLFIVDPETAANGKILDTKNQTIIAESGVTDLTIDKIDIKSITTPSVESGTGTSTMVKFDIYEPGGAGMIDKIFYQAIGLGIGNWAVMPVYLQLQFRCRDPDTEESLKDGTTGDLASLKWVWPLKLTSIKANVTTAGTEYNVDAITYHELVQSNAYFTMSSPVVLKNLKSVNDAITELSNKLNEDQLLKLIDNYSIPDIYKFVIDPSIATEPLYSFNVNEGSSRSGSFVNMTEKDATFTPGTSIDKIIDTIMAHTPKFQKSLVGSNTPGEEGLPAESQPSQIKQMWRIITESRPLQFDPRRQDDAREFTIYIVEYDIGNLESNVFQEANGDISIAVQRKRLATYLDKSILVKKYNYIFTGLNDQIINLNLTVNNAFATAQARMGGIYSNLAMASTGVAYRDASKEESDITARLRAFLSFNNTAASKSTDTIDSLRSSINASTLPVDTKQRYLTLLEQSKPENRLNYVKSAAYGGINQDASGAIRSPIVNLAKKNADEQLTFVSDVNLNLKDPKNNTASVYDNYLKNVKGKLRPIAHIEQLQDMQIGTSLESSNNSGIQKLSSMFSTALHSGLDSSFQLIKFTIKGDPYWLSPRPFSGDNRSIYNSLKPDSEALEWIKDADLRNSGKYINIYGSDTFLIIRFRTPRISNIEEESISSKDSYSDVETFSGVYKVTRITSVFSNGTFTQELECVLDQFINIVNFTDEIENNAKIPDIPATAKDIATTNTSIPVTAIKTEKLAIPDNTQGKGVVSEGATANTLGTKLSDDMKIAREQGQKKIDSLRGK